MNNVIVKNDNNGKEVTIVGAGPAGLVCAIILAKVGIPVIVRESHNTVGARFHDDYQGLENWSGHQDVIEKLKSVGIDSNFDHHPVSNGTVFDAWGSAYTIESKQAMYYIVRRGPGPKTLDAGLLQQALDVGVDVKFNDKVTKTEGSMVLGIGPRTADAIAVGYVFETDMADESWICFDDYYAPKGYSYLLIHSGRGTVASCMFSEFKSHDEYVSRTVSMFEKRVGLKMKNARPFGGYANFRIPDTAMQGGCPVIGEQAGFQDALAGFGMRYAIHSGVLAAQSLIENIDYTTLWRQQLLPQMRASVTNRFLFNLFGDRGWRWMMKNRLKGDNVREQLHDLYRPSRIKDILFPLAEWRNRQALNDKSCNHDQCTCVYCKCGGHENITSKP